VAVAWTIPENLHTGYERPAWCCRSTFAVRHSLLHGFVAVHCALCTVYSVLCAVCCVHCTQCTRVHSVRGTLYALRCTLYAVRCTLYAVRCTLYAVRCTPVEISGNNSIWSS
jgi:hypothetical protein